VSVTVAFGVFCAMQRSAATTAVVELSRARVSVQQSQCTCGIAGRGLEAQCRCRCVEAWAMGAGHKLVVEVFSQYADRLDYLCSL
jgi:hypothetical protein